jgi:hypothetical protein
MCEKIRFNYAVDSIIDIYTMTPPHTLLDMSRRNGETII